jgi:phage-related minor tail protein
VVGAAFVKGFADAIETENIGDVIAARVGEGAAESEQFARVSAKVYRDAWGQSTAEVGDAVDAVYSTLADSRGSEEALADLTERAQAFADVFNQDVGQAVSNAGVLIETGLARDAVEAFDLMTAAAQRVPAAMRDELGEATQEYSTFFATLGFDGRESFAILTDAAQEGRYELDKTGDAIKELSIRATDLNDVAAMSALEDLGLDARNTVTDLLAGGEAARIATQDILDALSSVEDPAEQAAIAVALMGAPLEDLNKSEIPEFVDRLADASDGMKDVEGASEDLTNSLQNTQSELTKVIQECLLINIEQKLKKNMEIKK